MDVDVLDLGTDLDVEAEFSLVSQNQASLLPEINSKTGKRETIDNSFQNQSHHK